LLSEDGTAALVVGWVRRGPPEKLFVDEVDRSLGSKTFRASAEGKALRVLIDEVRLAVMMGEREGPPDTAVAKALTQAAEGSGPEAPFLRGLLELSEERAAAPQTAAHDAILRVIAEGGDDGIRRLPVGSPFVRGAMLVGYPAHVHLGFIGLFAALFVLVGRRRESLLVGMSAVAAGGVALGGAVGVLGWFGLPLHPMSAQFLLGLALLAALGLLGAGTPRQPRLELLLLVLLPWCSRDLHGVSGLALSGALATAWTVVWVWGREATRTAAESSGLDPELLGLTRRPSRGAVFAATLLVAGGIGAATSQPLGIRPALWLPPDGSVGSALRLMSEKLGGGTPAHLISTTAEGGLADPERLSELHAAAAALAEDPSVDSVVGWTDFLSTVHSAVSGAPAGSLPERADLVQQYLLMFDRPSETRPLVASDRSLGVGFVRMAPGRDGAIARLAERFPAGTGAPALAGEGVALVLGGLLATRSLALLLGLGLLVSVGALLWAPAPGSRATPFDERLTSTLRAVHSAVPSGCVAVGAAALVAGAMGTEALLAGAAVAGTALAVAGCDERDRLQAFVLVGVGLGALVLGPIVPLRGLGLGVICGSVAALGLGRTAG
jgi:hypothetical protein